MLMDHWKLTFIFSTGNIKKDAKLVTTIMRMYQRCGQPLLAISEYEKMQGLISPDYHLYSCVLSAIADVGVFSSATFELCKHILGMVETSDCGFVLENSLLNAYAKCGDISLAKRLFNHIRTKRVPELTLWNTMLSAFWTKRMATEAVTLFEELESLQIAPDHITFVLLLSVLSHHGLADLCQQYYHNMEVQYSIII